MTDEEAAGPSGNPPGASEASIGPYLAGVYQRRRVGDEHRHKQKRSRSEAPRMDPQTATLALLAEVMRWRRPAGNQPSIMVTPGTPGR